MTAWTPPPDSLSLQSHRVDVWRIHLASIVPHDASLSEDELQRASRFHFEKDRSHYIIARVSLRGILSRYLQCDPRGLKFSANEYGKPFLPDHKMEFNLSHSGDFALIAVARGRKVGVDVELIREDVELENLAARYFSPREVSEFMALSPEQRTLGFFNCWTRKEAYIKAQGRGLSLPLDGFDVSLSPNEPAILRATRPDAHEAPRWRLTSLDVHSGYAGAVAAQGKELDLRYWNYAG